MPLRHKASPGEATAAALAILLSLKPKALGKGFTGQAIIEFQELFFLTYQQYSSEQLVIFGLFSV